MNGNILIALAAGGGLIIGAGATWLVASTHEVAPRAPTSAEIAAYIAANPSLVPPPAPPALIMPTEAEALAAYRKAYARNPMRWGDVNATSLKLGECDKSGLGVSCMATIKLSDQTQPSDRVVGFSKAASGEWVATNY